MPMMNEAGVDRVCIVPPSWEGDRVDYAIEAAGKFPGRFGIMGRIALGNPQSATLLPTWKEQTGMLGIRVSFTYPQQYEKLSDGSLDWFWPACEKAGIPLMFNAPGRMPAYGVDPVDSWRRAASYVDRILRGAKPAELPVQLPIKFEMVVNRKTATALGLAIPPSIMLRADEVIE